MVAMKDRIRSDINMTPAGVVVTIRSLRVAIAKGQTTQAKGEVKHLARLTSLLIQQGFGHLLAD